MVGNWSLVLRACLGSMVKQPFTVIPSEAEGVRVSIHHLLSVIARELMLTALVAWNFWVIKQLPPEGKLSSKEVQVLQCKWGWRRAVRRTLAAAPSHLVPPALPCVLWTEEAGLRWTERCSYPDGAFSPLCDFPWLFPQGPNKSCFAPRLTITVQLLPCVPTLCVCVCCMGGGEVEVRGQPVRVSCLSAHTLEGPHEASLPLAPEAGVVSNPASLSQRHAKVILN